MTPADLIKSSKRIVIKIGSAILVDEKTGNVRQEWLQSIANDIATLIQEGKEIAVVSSGAIALGRKSLNIDYTDRPSSISLDKKQAAAAIGNVHMSKAYCDAFKAHNRQTALVLLSPKDTEERQAHLNARATLLTLLAHKSIPIINENDTVATAEIRFGDNDRLAARVAQMIEADLLIQLSTTDGLYTGDPTQIKTAKHIPLVENYSDDLLDMAGDAPAGISTGGMKSKLEAARISTQAGVHMIIASGNDMNPLKNMERATIFIASDKPISSRKKWISSHVKTKGTVTIDSGAAKALKSGKSLLAAGVKSIEGDFNHGDPIAINDLNGQKLAIGLVAYNNEEANSIIGHNSQEISDILGYSRGDALIHRDNLVLSG